jgi:hypothetical protein
MLPDLAASTHDKNNGDENHNPRDDGLPQRSKKCSHGLAPYKISYVSYNLLTLRILAQALRETATKPRNVNRKDSL